MSKRSLFTATFWLDTAERTIRTGVAAVVGVLSVSGWPTATQWGGIGITAATTVGMCVLASGVGEPGTASVMNPAPPDTLGPPA